MLLFWLFIFEVSISVSLGLTVDDVLLVKTLSDKYKLDYRVIIVDTLKDTNKFYDDRNIYSQIITASNVANSFDNKTRNINVGYFLLLESDENTRRILQLIEPKLMKMSSWFIKTDHIEENFGLSLRFDSDINFLHKTTERWNLYEVFLLKNEVVITSIGNFSQGVLSIDQTNLLERRTNLHGLNLK